MQKFSKNMPQTNDDSQNGCGDINEKLQIMSERLESIQHRLYGQREKCPTKLEKMQIDQLRKEAKKQAAAISKLQESVEDSLNIMAMSSQALDGPVLGINNANEILFQVIAGPLQERHRVLHQNRSIDFSKKLKLWSKRISSAQKESRTSSASSNEPYLSTTSAESDDLPVPTIEELPTLSVDDSDSDSEYYVGLDEGAVSHPSNTSSQRISVHDWGILTLPEGSGPPPALPRKSSRRAHYTPRVPPPTHMPPVPPMPTTPAPSVPEPVEPLAASTENHGAQFILSNLEKRFNLTLTTPKTPRTVPSCFRSVEIFVGY